MRDEYLEDDIARGHYPDDYVPDPEDWVCPICHGTRTIQPDRYTPPEPCYCVDEDEAS